ncbi:MAG: anthranilate synthase component I [Planctomycetes bacterium]|nr:anthranilate synthase component I [Planctomycetota bacterium]
MTQPSFNDFQSDYDAGRTVRVHARFLADALTPIAAFLKLENGPHAFLLESVTGGENVGRYSFVGSDPIQIFRAFPGRVEIEGGGDSGSLATEDVFGELGKLLKRYGPVAPDPLPRMAGGAVGYVGYDAVRFLERLPKVPKDDLGLPDLFFGVYDTLVIFDNVDKSLRVVVNAFPGSGPARSAYDAAAEKIAGVAEALASPMPVAVNPIQPLAEDVVEYASNFGREEFLEAVRRCQEYIRAGDVFQVVLSQRLRARTRARPFDIYRALRTINPSPYMFYQSFGDLKLIGASPEVMVRVEDGTVTVRPIAGTRRRGRNEEEDAAMARELLSDPKEIAEHVMLLDLGRNDVGRISDFHTVAVTQKMSLERYSHVMHMTSNVQGRLSRGRTAMDALKACFPAGTVTGAPKIRAMEIIDELEPTKRGPYAGAVGYMDFAGNLDTAIAIRTILLNQQDAYIQAGAGIVADSVPEREFQETLNKARALLRALQVAEQQM